MTTVYSVTHRTVYKYEGEVTTSYGQVHLLPRDLEGQRCRRGKIELDPQPSRYRERTDFFGNRVGYFVIEEPHRELTVTATSVVEVDERTGAMSLFGQRAWELVRDGVRAGEIGDRLDVAQYILDSPLAAADDLYRDYAQKSFTPGRNLLDAITSLCSRIHSDFKYEPGSTSVSTPLAEVFEQREGVCQDFAHLGIACLRSIGLPARYVSGYLDTLPPPGKPKLLGVDGSHAWLSALVPDAGWIDFDPTNDQIVNGRYVVTAFGRDYGDVPPMNGVIYTQGKTDSLKVTVDVIALPGDGGRS